MGRLGPASIVRYDPVETAGSPTTLFDNFLVHLPVAELQCSYSSAAVLNGIFSEISGGPFQPKWPT
jgi:hypothetical protein